MIHRQRRRTKRERTEERVTTNREREKRISEREKKNKDSDEKLFHQIMTSSAFSPLPQRRTMKGIPTQRWCGKNVVVLVSWTKKNPYGRF
ncbi:hypothetical protein Bca4012_002686 [Brassica carinata]